MLIEGVTFKDLKKRFSIQTSQQQSQVFERLRSKRFWIWDIEEHKKAYRSAMAGNRDVELGIERNTGIRPIAIGLTVEIDIR